MTPNARERLWQRLEPHVSAAAHARRQRRGVLRASVVVGAMLAVGTVWWQRNISHDNAWAMLRLEGGKTVSVGRATVTLERGQATAETQNRIFLEWGRIIVQVRGVFAVQTSEASVEVLGTHFVVSREPVGGRTRVLVIEGRVRVRPRAELGVERILGARESWEIRAPPGVRPEATSNRAVASPSSRIVMPEQKSSGTPSVTMVPGRTQTLAPQVDPLSEADIARTAGDFSRAIELYWGAARVTTGLRSENAFVEAGLLCEKLSAWAQAVVVWSDYLKRHPSGVHRAQGLFGLAIAEDKRGNRGVARVNAQEVVDRYPDSIAAEQARTLLQKLAVER